MSTLVYEERDTRLINNLAYRKENGSLARELPYMKVALGVIRCGNFSRREKQNAENVFALACETMGVDPYSVTYDPNSIEVLQTKVFAMIGPAMCLGSFATEQPASFYIDTRCGRFPYNKREIYKAVKELAAAAVAKGLDPRNLPRVPLTHNMGVF